MRSRKSFVSRAFPVAIFGASLLCGASAFGQQQVVPQTVPKEASPPTGKAGVIEAPNQPEDSFAGRISLGALVAYARAHNPEIQAAEQRYRAAQARPSQAGSLPDPIIEGAYHNEKITPFTLGQSEFSFLRFGASQEVPFPGKLSLRENIAAREAEREGQALRATILNVSAALKVAYADLAFTHRALEILRHNKGVLEDLEKSAAARYRVGRGIQQDVVKAQVEVSLLTSRLIQFESKKEGLKATINGLLNRPPLAVLGTPEPLQKSQFTLAVEQVRDLALENSPDLKGADIAIARNELGLTLSRREYFPDFVFRADYMNKSALLPEWELGVGVKVPLYFWRKQRYGVREAAAGLGEARGTRQNVIQTLLARVKDLYVQARAAEQLLTLYQTTIIPQSRLSLESAWAGYGVGAVDFLTMLNNVLVLYEAEISYEEQLAEFEKNLAQLEQIVGAPVAGK